MHLHHQHDLEHVHYEPAVHDDYPRHHHVWTGNHNFNTCLDDDDCCADDHQLTVGADHDHPGYDIRWADQHSRTTQPPGTATPTA